MQGIVTRFAGPTDHSGARIIVTAQKGRIVVPWDYSLDVAQNHRAACLAALLKWDWRGQWVGGSTPDDTGYMFAPVPSQVEWAKRTTSVEG